VVLKERYQKKKNKNVNLDVINNRKMRAGLLSIIYVHLWWSYQAGS
jgi:hypothetical protein